MGIVDDLQIWLRDLALLKEGGGLRLAVEIAEAAITRIQDLEDVSRHAMHTAWRCLGCDREFLMEQIEDPPTVCPWGCQAAVEQLADLAWVQFPDDEELPLN